MKKNESKEDKNVREKESEEDKQEREKEEGECPTEDDCGALYLTPPTTTSDLM